MALEQTESLVEIINNGVHDGHDCLAQKIHTIPLQDIDTNGVKVVVGVYEPHPPGDKKIEAAIALENAAITASVMGADAGRRAVVIAAEAEYARVIETVNAKKGADRDKVVIVNGEEFSIDTVRKAILEASLKPDSLASQLPKSQSALEEPKTVTLEKDSSPEHIAEVTAKVRGVGPDHPLVLKLGQGVNPELIRQRVMGYLSEANLPYIQLEI